MLLAIDTSTSAVGVALLDPAAGAGSGRPGDVREVLALERVDPRRHGELLAPMVQEALREAGDRLSGIAVGVGPGPFTGLRVGVVTALVLGHARELPVHGVGSLDALALAAVREATQAGDDLGEELLVATDARRKEVFWGRYAVTGHASDPGDPGGTGVPVRRLDGPRVGPAGELPTGLPCAGRGPVIYPEQLATAVPPQDVPAAAVGRLAAIALAGPGREEWLLPPEPVYLRRPDAAAPGPAKPVAPVGGRGAGRGRGRR